MLDSIVRFTAVVVLLLGLCFSDVIAETNKGHYTSSIIVRKKSNKDHTIALLKGKNNITVSIAGRSLDAYMHQEGLGEVEITTEAFEQKITLTDGTSYYQLDFIFGPSSAFFTPDSLILTLKGKYVSNGVSVWLYDENGEAIDGRRKENKDMIQFEIDHFSNYYYDSYEY